MAKIETSTVDTSTVLLGNNDFETGLLAAVPANTIVKAGTYLKRDGEKFAVLTNPASEKVVGIVPFDVENEKSSVADVPFRALIAGRVRADKVLLNGNKPTVEQLDMLRACGISPSSAPAIKTTGNSSPFDA